MEQAIGKQAGASGGFGDDGTCAPSRIVIVTLLMISTLTVMAGATISPALPDLQARFARIPDAKLLIGLLLTVPAAAIALTAPVAGILADRIGRRTLLVLAILLYAAAGTSGLWLSGIWALLAGRVLLGVAVGAIMATATALVGDLVRGDARTKLVSWQAAATSFGGVVFLLAGGELADLSCRGPFAVYGLTLPLAWMAWRFLGTSPSAAPRANEQSTGKTSVAAIAAIAAIAACSGAAFYMVPTRLPFRLAEIGTRGGLWSGGTIGATVMASGIAALLAGRIARAIGRQFVLVLGLALLGAGLFVVGAVGRFAPMIAGLLLIGAGQGMLQPTLTAMALDAAASPVRGRVSGLLASAIFAGQFASPLISAPLEAVSGLASAYRLIGMASAGLAALVGAVVLTRGTEERVSQRVGASA